MSSSKSNTQVLSKNILNFTVEEKKSFKNNSIGQMQSSDPV